MSTNSKRILPAACFVLSAAALMAQPSVNSGGILNAASYAYSGLPNSGIAQGSLFIVFGKNLGPSAIQQANSYPLPKTLAGTSAKVTVNGSSVDCIMVYTLASQLVAILPSATPVGTGTLTVTYNGQTSAPAPINVVANSFGIFTVNQAGSGPGIVTDANYRVLSFGGAAKPGDTLIIWGTGVGAVSGDEAAGPRPGDLNTPGLEVWVGSQKAAVTYRGRSGCCGGLDQIGFVVPAGTQGCYVSVAVKINSTVSNFVTIPVAASGSYCSDANGLSSSDLQTLLNKGTFSTGVLSLSRNDFKIVLPAPVGTIESKTDAGSGAFYRYTPAVYNASINGQTASIGSCTVFTFQGANGRAVDPVLPTPLDAGPVINVTGPGGSAQLKRDSSGIYSASLGGGSGLPTDKPLFLSAGSYSFDNASGGADIGAFKASITIGTPLNWMNIDAIPASIPRASGVNVTWTGGDPAGFVNIIGSSFTLSPTVGATFICTAPASAGQFTVPPPVLLALPASSADSSGGFAMPSGILGVTSAANPTKFSASGLDLGLVQATSSSTKSVSYQ